MAETFADQPLEAVIAEYTALFEGSWKPSTKVHYRDSFRKLLDWLGASGRSATTSSLDFKALLEFVNHLRDQPSLRGAWRLDQPAVRRARRPSEAPRVSLNSVNSRMRALRSLVLWARDEGLVQENPFARKYARGTRHPLLPSEERPPKGATASDLLCLEKGCEGRAPIDLRDQAIVSVMLTTGARNSSARLLRLEDVDLDRNSLTFRLAKSDETFVVALQPETKAAVLRYVNRGRKRMLARYPVRGFETIAAGRDSGALFLASDRGYGIGEPLTASGCPRCSTVAITMVVERSATSGRIGSGMRSRLPLSTTARASPSCLGTTPTARSNRCVVRAVLARSRQRLVAAGGPAGTPATSPDRHLLEPLAGNGEWRRSRQPSALSRVQALSQRQTGIRCPRRPRQVRSRLRELREGAIDDRCRPIPLSPQHDGGHHGVPGTSLAAGSRWPRRSR